MYYVSNILCSDNLSKICYWKYFLTITIDYFQNIFVFDPVLFNFSSDKTHLVDGSKDLFGDLLTSLEIMISIGQDLGLDNGHDSRALADRGVSGQDVGILEDSQLAGTALFDLQDATPLGKVATVLLVLDAARLEIVKALGRAFVVGAEERNDAFVDFDTWDDITLLQQLDKRRAVISLLIERFVKEDHAGDVLSDDILRMGKGLTFFYDRDISR